ncbi:UNVERIFIED_CONTAM: hypothetical protein PYX00_006503 [Menopon gallinae]|uniref:Gustatory receptor n=1 Tax=Menopon gallinae TaxID=328185 RepID=A0AAW2HW40_9NEOP
MPEIARDFSEIENHMTDYEKPKRLGLKIASFLLVFFVLATIEHGTMTVLHFQRALDIAGNGTDNFGHAFYVMHFPSVSRVVPYSGLMTIMFTWANAICTFNWNLLDFFLIGISMEISAKFDLITNKLTSCDPEKQNYEFWRKTYTDYGRIVILTKKLDRILSSVILTSFFSNLYHLSLQLLRSLRISGTLFHRLYFYFSLSYLILRLLTSLFSMANVNEAGKKPKDLLFLMENHCTASLRLLEQILTDDIHLTGNRIFTINRSFVFSIIGTIITYQVVLLQFDSLTFVDAD